MKRGILLVNLGSPAAPTPRAVGTFLRRFLMDKNVIDIPLPLRWLLVNGIIAPFRASRSARAYASIWTGEGSPLIVHSNRLTQALQEQLSFPVSLGMRYGKPSMEEAMIHLVRDEGVEEILLLPLYPHYALSTTASTVEEAKRIIRRHGLAIVLNVQPPIYDDPAYIQALVASAEPFIKRDSHLLFSYHALPLRHLRKADPTGRHCMQVPDCCTTPSPAHRTCYRHQLLETTRLFAARVGLESERFSIAFQSRLGRAKWMSPSTHDEILRLAKSGVKHLTVIAPSFVTECLETVEELGIREKRAYLSAGGESFTLVPCLNDHPLWIEALAAMAR